MRLLLPSGDLLEGSMQADLFSRGRDALDRGRLCEHLRENGPHVSCTGLLALSGDTLCAASAGLRSHRAPMHGWEYHPSSLGRVGGLREELRRWGVLPWSVHARCGGGRRLLGGGAHLPERERTTRVQCIP